MNKPYCKILISSCFLGNKVRYDGQAKVINHPVIALWQQQNRLVPVCPEVSGGLSVPRSPAEIQGDTGKVLTCDGKDVTRAFLQGAEHALAVCRNHNIQFALLKESSPSCGSQLIYDGTFSGRKIKGQGVCSQVLSANGIAVYSEASIEKLIAVIAHQDSLA